MTKKEKKYWIIGIIVGCLLFMTGGFFLGRWSNSKVTKTKIEYIKLAPIHDTITSLKPYAVIQPVDTNNIIKNCIKSGVYDDVIGYRVITKTDTLYIPTKRDTTQIMVDWASRREYAQTLFDIDTVGKCDVYASVQYNRIDTLSYTFTPIQKVVTKTVEKKRVISPFLGVGMMSSPSVNAAVGMYIKEHCGFSVNYGYQIDSKKNEFGGMFYYKF